MNISSIERYRRAIESLSANIADGDQSDDHLSDDEYIEPVLNGSPMSDDEAPRSVENEKRNLLNQFLVLCDSKRRVKTTSCYHRLQQQSKSNFLSSARHLLRHLVEFLAPTDADEVWQDLILQRESDSLRLID